MNVTKQMTLNESDILIIEGNNRENWKLGIIKNLMREKDGIVGVAKPRTGKFYLEWALEHLYPLELNRIFQRTVRDSEIGVPMVRSKQTLTIIAEIRIQDVMEKEQATSAIEWHYRFVNFVLATHDITWKKCIVNRRLLDYSKTFASWSVEATIMDEWRKGNAMFPHLEKNIFVQGHV